jgi:hypothetical protein
MEWHIQEGFILVLSGEFLSFSGRDEAARFHIDEVGDVINALKCARSHIRSEEIRAEEKRALARWGKKRIPTEVDSKLYNLLTTAEDEL